MAPEICQSFVVSVAHLTASDKSSRGIANILSTISMRVTPLVNLLGYSRSMKTLLILYTVLYRVRGIMFLCRLMEHKCIPDYVPTLYSIVLVQIYEKYMHSRS